MPVTVDDSSLNAAFFVDRRRLPCDRRRCLGRRRHRFHSLRSQPSFFTFFGVVASCLRCLRSSNRPPKHQTKFQPKSCKFQPIPTIPTESLTPLSGTTNSNQTPESPDKIPTKKPAIPTNSNHSNRIPDPPERDEGFQPDRRGRLRRTDLGGVRDSVGMVGMVGICRLFGWNFVWCFGGRLEFVVVCTGRCRRRRSQGSR